MPFKTFFKSLDNSMRIVVRGNDEFWTGDVIDFPYRLSHLMDMDVACMSSYVGEVNGKPAAIVSISLREQETAGW